MNKEIVNALEELIEDVEGKPNYYRYAIHIKKAKQALTNYYSTPIQSGEELKESLAKEAGAARINFKEFQAQLESKDKEIERLKGLIETAFKEGYARRNSNYYSRDWKEFKEKFNIDLK